MTQLSGIALAGPELAQKTEKPLDMNASRPMLGGLLLLLFSPGCADRNQLSETRKEIIDLSEQVGRLSKQVETLSEELDGFKRNKSMDDLFRDLEAVAYLTPGSDGYSVVQTDLGRMTVSLENVQPYANGSRVTLSFGNLTSATVNGAKAKIEWGGLDEKGNPKNEAQRSRDFSFKQVLRAGAWTNVSIVLEGVPPTDLGYVRVKEFGHTGISLSR